MRTIRKVAIVFAMFACVLVSDVTAWQKIGAERVRSLQVENDRGARDLKIRTLINLARSAGPEFGADGMLRTVTLAVGESIGWKRRTLEELFVLADRAATPFPLTPLPIGFTDTVPAMVGISSSLQIDRLSLQLRTVRTMLGIEPTRARQMFETISPPAIGKLTCEDLVIPDVSGYYEILQSVAEATFTTHEIERGHRERLLARGMLGSLSPVHVFPIARMLSDIKIDDGEKSRLIGAFMNAVAAIRGDDRAFTMALMRDESASHMRMLMQVSQQVGLSPSIVVDAFSKFYSYHLAARRCSDAVSSPSLQQRQQEAMTRFSEVSRSLDDHRPTSFTNGKEVDEKVANARDLWNTVPEFRTFVMRMAKLEPGQAPMTNDYGWISDVRETTRTIETWSRPNGISAEEFFIVKSQLLARLCRIASPAKAYQQVAEAYVRFLETSRSTRDATPALWLYSVKRALDAAEVVGPSGVDAFVSAFASARDPVLTLYAELAKAGAFGTAGSKTVSNYSIR